MRALVGVLISVLVACRGTGSRDRPQGTRATGESNRIELLEKGCNTKNGSDCVDLGARYSRGTGVAQDYVKAARYYGLGCDAGDAAGCHAAGQAYLLGAGVPKDAARATALLTQACDGGDPHGCFKLGSVLAGGALGPPTDPAAGLLSLVKACELGHGGGCFRAGTLLERGAPGVEPDLVRATAYCKIGCGATTTAIPPGIGDAASCWRLGILYSNGLVVARGKTEGEALLALTLEHYSKQCDGGNAADCLALGAIHATGEGVTLDATRALQLFDRACTLENPAGCQWAEQLRSTGEPIPP